MTHSKSISSGPISLTSISHPTFGNIETQLSILRTWESSSSHAPNAEVISNGLCRLVEVYICMNEFLNSPETHQALSKHKEEKWVDGLLEVPIKLLDICSNIRELVSEVKEIVREFQCSLRRNKGDLNIQGNVDKFKSSRKRMKESINTLITSLKQIDQDIGSTEILGVVDQHLSSFIRFMREVNVMSVICFRSLSVFLSSSKVKRSKWSVSRMIRKGTVACESQENNSNVLDRLDFALSSHSETNQSVAVMLKKLEASCDCIEKRLDHIFRCLINSRISLLNIVSSSSEK